MSHRDILRFIVKVPVGAPVPFPQEEKEEEQDTRKPVFVLFGGSTSERQVSLMSGTNVWLKLRKSNRFSPRHFCSKKMERPCGNFRMCLRSIIPWKKLQKVVAMQKQMKSVFDF